MKDITATSFPIRNLWEAVESPCVGFYWRFPLNLVSRQKQSEGEMIITCNSRKELLRELRFARDTGLFGNTVVALERA